MLVVPGAPWPQRPALAPLLVQRARRWAGALAPGATVWTLEAGADRAEAALALLREVGKDAALVVVSAEATGLGEAHARSLADDLRAGVDVAFGPDTGGGLYLIAAAPGHGAAAAEIVARWDEVEARMERLRATLESGLSIGMLRSERPLHDESDVAALLADPRTDAELRAALA